MKTVRPFLSFVLSFIFCGQLLAQNLPDDRQIVVPDRNTLIDWVSSDGVFSIALAISMVSLFLWLAFLATNFLMTVEPTGNKEEKKPVRHAIPQVRMPRVELHMPGFGQFGTGLAPASRKTKQTPDTRQERQEMGNPTRGGNPDQWA